MRHLIIYGALAALAGALAVTQVMAVNRDVYRAKLDYTKYICDKGHNEYSDYTENECGRMQDETSTEYLCSQTGSYCWLEVK